MYCPKCGTKNQDDHQFCRSCGFQINASEPGIPVSGLAGLSLADLTENKFLQHALSGKYEIVRELGRGGFGVVFEALDVRLNRKVAIKVLLLTHSSEESLVKRFINEAKLSASLDHPGIVRIYTIDSANAIHFFIMEYIQGPTLKKVIVDQSCISPFHTIKHCREIVKALAYAHSKGIIHRDIKPHNIMLKHNEFPIITDFGIAKALDIEGTQLTSAAIGSPHYISPEQLRNEVIDARTDQYSLGIMMYEMLTGTPPFTGSGISIYQKQLYESPAPIQSVNPNIPDEIAEIVHRMLEKDKGQRYSTTQDVLAALEAIDVAKLSRQVATAEATLVSTQESISDIIRSAREAMEKREFDRALSLCEMGRQMDQDNHELIYLLQQVKASKDSANIAKEQIDQGIEQFHAKHYSEAIEFFYKALVLDKSNTEVPKLIERAQQYQAEYRRAEKDFQEGKKLFEARKYTEALKKFKEAEKVDTGFPDLSGMIRLAEAEEIASQEIKNLVAEASGYLEQKLFSEAIRLFTLVLDKSPNHEIAAVGIQKAKSEMSRLEEVQRLQAKVTKLTSSGQFIQAINLLEQLQKICPENAGDFEIKIAQLEETIESDKKISGIAEKARAASLDKNYPHAMELWIQVRDMNPRDPKLVEEMKQAMRILKESIPSKPSIPETIPSAPSVIEQKGISRPKSDRDVTMMMDKSSDVGPAAVDGIKAPPQRPVEASPVVSRKRSPVFAAVAGILVVIGGAAAIWYYSSRNSGDGDLEQTAKNTEQVATQIPTALQVAEIPPTSVPAVVPTSGPVVSETAIPTLPEKSSATPALPPTIPGKDPTLARYIQSARFDFNNLDYRGALRTIESALAQAPMDSEALAMKNQIQEKLLASNRAMSNANSLYSTGNYQAAAKSLQELCSWDPYNMEARDLLGRIQTLASMPVATEPVRPTPQPAGMTPPAPTRQPVVTIKAIEPTQGQQAPTVKPAPPTPKPVTPLSKSTPIPTQKPSIPTAKPAPTVEKIQPKTNSPPKITQFNTPSSVSPGSNATFEVTVDDPEGIKNIYLYYRPDSSSSWQKVSVGNIPPGKATKSLSIPGNAVSKNGVEVYLEVEDMEGNIQKKNDASSPKKIKAKSSRAVPPAGM